MAIATFFPAVDKRDFNFLSWELCLTLRSHYRAVDVEIQPSPIGDAFVSFSSPLERQRFLDAQPIAVGQY